MALWPLIHSITDMTIGTMDVYSKSLCCSRGYWVNRVLELNVFLFQLLHCYLLLEQTTHTAIAKVTGLWSSQNSRGKRGNAAIHQPEAQAGSWRDTPWHCISSQTSAVSCLPAEMSVSFESLIKNHNYVSQWNLEKQLKTLLGLEFKVAWVHQRGSPWDTISFRSGFSMHLLTSSAMWLQYWTPELLVGLVSWLTCYCLFTFGFNTRLEILRVDLFMPFPQSLQLVNRKNWCAFIKYCQALCVCVCQADTKCKDWKCVPCQITNNLVVNKYQNCRDGSLW